MSVYLHLLHAIFLSHYLYFIIVFIVTDISYPILAGFLILSYVLF